MEKSRSRRPPTKAAAAGNASDALWGRGFPARRETGYRPPDPASATAKSGHSFARLAVPASRRAVVQRLKWKGTVEKISELSYKEVLFMLEQIEQKESGSAPNHPIEWSKEDKLQLLERKKLLEAKTEELTCTEGKVVEASVDQKINFGALTSCMAIICVLEDGSKVGAHDNTYKLTSGGAIKAVKEKVGDRKVTKILVAVVRDQWDAKGDPIGKHFEDLTDYGQIGSVMKKKSLANVENRKGLEKHLAIELGSKEVEINHFKESGGVTVSKEGNMKV